jgi:hypothetical protein
MLWIHPLVQIAVTLLALWVMEMGVRRALFVHLGRRSVLFPWKRHVLWGKVVLLGWLAGLVVGVWAMRHSFGTWGVSGAHYTASALIAALVGTGYASGHLLDRVKKRRRFLHVFHGLNNTALLALALFQLWTGWGLVRMFLLP